MKGTDHFKRTIQMYLEQRAEEDTLFAKNYRNPAKNIDDCVTYILNYVRKAVVTASRTERYTDKQYTTMTRTRLRWASLSNAKWR